MINKRELRIAIFYFTLVALMILTIWILKVTSFVHKGSVTTFTVFISILMSFLFLATIVCLIVFIYHLIKAFRFYKKVEDEKQYLIWEYDIESWKKFIGVYFKINIADDIKSFKKFGKKFFPIALVGLTILFVLDSRIREHTLVYFSLPFLIFLIYFLWVVGRNVIKAIDHIIFTDYKVILMANGTIIINGEHINRNSIGVKELKINDGFIEINYVVSGKASHERNTVLDLRRIRIPIPRRRYKEAENYINKLIKVHKL